MTKLKNSIKNWTETEEFKIRLDYADNRVSDLEDRTFEIIQPEKQKEMRIKRVKNTYSAYGTQAQ